jgi:hypothetical protein
MMFRNMQASQKLYPERHRRRRTHRLPRKIPSFATAVTKSDTAFKYNLHGSGIQCGKKTFVLYIVNVCI